MDKSGKKFFASTLNLFILLSIVFALIYYISSDRTDSGGINIHFLSVGQGDAELIQDTAGKNILIDGGPDSTVVGELEKYTKFYQRKIDVIILTHPHADHVNGLVDVVEKYQVGHVYLTGVLHTAPEYIKFLSLLKEKNIPTTDIMAGDSLSLSDGATLKFLYPNTKLVGSKVDNLNSTSVVAKIIYGDKSAIFMGDLEDEGQIELMKLSQDLTADILKVSHHGSKYASNINFLKIVNPKVAIIEVGKNNQFGHPHSTTISNLNSLGVQLYRTDIDSDVNIQMTKTDIKVMK
ncbi:MAG: MBL fold metallo-hydrolase [bacterium]